MHVAFCVTWNPPVPLSGHCCAMPSRVMRSMTTRGRLHLQPSTLIPVLSACWQSLLTAMRGDKQVQRPTDPLYEMATDNVLCRRHMVLKSGTDQSNPTSFTRLSKNSVVCRNGSPNSTLSLRQACIAALLSAFCLPRRPEGTAPHAVSASNQTFGTLLHNALPVSGSTAILVASVKGYTLPSSGSDTS